MFRKLALVAVSFLMCMEGRADTCEYTIERVAYKNLVANLYRPTTPHPVPAVIAFGGSEGGLSTGNSSGEMLAPNCIAVLGLAYFKETGLPPTLDQIPLEYFIDAIDYVSRAQNVDAARIGIVSGSRGSEAALLVASMDARIKSVVVATPSEVAWSGRTTATSAWTYHGTDIPALSLDDAESLPQLKRFDNALDNIGNWPKYRIPVERINGPIFLISAENDQVWPSRRMSEDIVKYLRLQNFRFQVRHDAYPTGHGFNAELAPKIKQSVVDRFLDTL
jgi:dienelactone hydrolase